MLTDARKHRPDLVVVDDVRAAGDLGRRPDRPAPKETFLEDGTIGLVGDDILPAAIDRQLLQELPGLTLEPEPIIVAALRAIKSPGELALLRRAALCADAALMTANAMIRRGGVTEREVCAEAIAAAMRAGADFVRYFRVHSGPWSAFGSRWPQAMNRPIEPGEIVALDAIGAYQGYGFDVNRTTVCGEPDAETRRLLETTLEATNAAVAADSPGHTGRAVADAAVEVMQRGRYGDYFGGMLGHGIGLETVELPYLKVGEPTELQPNMVLCVEPGLFIPDVAGAAIEQEVIVHAIGPAEIITPTPPTSGSWTESPESDRELDRPLARDRTKMPEIERRDQSAVTFSAGDDRRVGKSERKIGIPSNQLECGRYHALRNPARNCPLEQCSQKLSQLGLR